LRIEQKKKQREVAEYLNINQDLFSRYETGVRNVPNDILKKLARYFYTSTDYLLGETDIKIPYLKRETELPCVDKVRIR